MSASGGASRTANRGWFSCSASHVIQQYLLNRKRVRARRISRRGDDRHVGKLPRCFERGSVVDCRCVRCYTRYVQPSSAVVEERTRRVRDIVGETAAARLDVREPAEALLELEPSSQLRAVRLHTTQAPTTSDRRTNKRSWRRRRTRAPTLQPPRSRRPVRCTAARLAPACIGS